MAVVNTPSAGSRKVSFCTVQPSGSRFCVNDDSNACVPKGKVGTKIATHCQVPRTAHHLPKTRTPPERVWGKGGVSGTPHGGRYRRRVARFEAITRKMQSARNVKLMTGDLRSALEIAGAAKLDAHLRFVKRTNDVVTTICYLLHKTPLMKEGALAPITLTMNNLNEFAGAMLENKPIIENVLGLEVRADVRTKPMTQLNAILKLVGLSCKPQKKKAKGRMIYPYRLDQASYDRMLRLVEKRRATDGWRTLYEMHGWDMKEIEDEPEPGWDGQVRSWQQRPSSFAEVLRRASSLAHVPEGGQHELRCRASTSPWPGSARQMPHRRGSCRTGYRHAKIGDFAREPP